jgi:hypothetical protein
MDIAQTIKPLDVRVGFANFLHAYIVAEWLHLVNDECLVEV